MLKKIVRACIENVNREDTEFWMYLMIWTGYDEKEITDIMTKALGGLISSFRLSVKEWCRTPDFTSFKMIFPVDMYHLEYEGVPVRSLFLAFRRIIPFFTVSSMQHSYSSNNSFQYVRFDIRRDLDSYMLSIGGLVWLNFLRI